MPAEALVAVAVVFALVTAVNDGGALLAPGTRVPALSVPVGLVMLTTAVVGVPLLVSTAVADTTATTIVPAGQDGPTALVIGFSVAVVVVMCSARMSLPTSLTLAVIGGIAGAGAGLGLAVAWASVLRVLAIGLAAPAVGALLALAGARLWRTAAGAAYLPTVRRAHVVAFAAQCVAYGANDGQKMLVLFIAAGGAGTAGATVMWWVYPVIAACFALGAVLGLPRMTRSMGTGLLSTRPTHAVTAEFASAAAVLGSAAVGTPVSMTQSVAGGLFGAGVHDSYRRLRWRVVRNLAVAWVVTLPASAGVAAAAGAVAGVAG